MKFEHKIPSQTKVYPFLENWVKTPKNVFLRWQIDPLTYNN